MLQVEVCAKLEVIDVKDPAKGEIEPVVSGESDDKHERKKGYAVTMKTEVTRLRDGAMIAEGTQTIWVPDYRHF